MSKVLRRRSGEVKRCYGEALRRNDSVKGEPVVKFQIGSAGRITDIRIALYGTGDAGVANCIKSAMKSCCFPSPEGGPVTLSFPFILFKG